MSYKYARVHPSDLTPTSSVQYTYNRKLALDDQRLDAVAESVIKLADALVERGLPLPNRDTALVYARSGADIIVSRLRQHQDAQGSSCWFSALEVYRPASKERAEKLLRREQLTRRSNEEYKSSVVWLREDGEHKHYYTRHQFPDFLARVNIDEDKTRYYEIKQYNVMPAHPAQRALLDMLRALDWQYGSREDAALGISYGKVFPAPQAEPLADTATATALDGKSDKVRAKRAQKVKDSAAIRKSVK